MAFFYLVCRSQDSVLVSPATTLGTTNDGIQQNHHEVSEEVSVNQSAMADNNPDNHHDSQITVCADNELEQLSTFVPVQPQTFQWGEIEGFTQALHKCYEEIHVVHWKQNLFKIPFGRAGKSFVCELTCTWMFQPYTDASALESVALQAVTDGHYSPSPPETPPESKAKEHTMHLDCWLKQWINDDIEGLLEEGRTIQHHLNSQHNRANDLQNTLPVSLEN